MRERNVNSAGLSAMLAAVCLALCLALPSPVRRTLMLAAAHAALPEGSIAALRAVRTSAQPDSPAAVLSETLPDVLPQDVTQTPEDISAWIREAEQNAVNEKKDGDIREKTYGANWATESFRGLQIRNVTEGVRAGYGDAWDGALPLVIDKTKPAVLLYHTHTTEGYETLDRNWYAADVSSRTEDARRSVVRVGSAIAEELTRAGFAVLHDTTIHDRKYNGAYDRSRQTVQSYLERYPGLCVTLDVHRDAIEQDNGVKIKPVCTIAGKKAAQIMLITGAEGGRVERFPDWRQNLAFALRVQDACETASPGLMRPIFFCHRKYNMDMTPCSLLVEVGSEANTLEEAVYAGRLFGRALASMLEAYTL